MIEILLTTALIFFAIITGVFTLAHLVAWLGRGTYDHLKRQGKPTPGFPEEALKEEHLGAKLLLFLFMFILNLTILFS